MTILQNENTTSITGSAPVTHLVKAEQKSTISRRMHAELKLNAHLMAESRDKIAVELAKNPNLDPQEMMDKIIQIQTVTKQVQELSEAYTDAPRTDLTAEDVEAMRSMANRYGQKVTADCFSTKQPAISDLLNGKNKVGK